MILDVILGINSDTGMWIKELKLNLSEHICVIDYDYYGAPTISDGVLYVSTTDAKEYFKGFDSVFFFINPCTFIQGCIT